MGYLCPSWGRTMVRLMLVEGTGHQPDCSQLLGPHGAPPSPSPRPVMWSLCNSLSSSSSPTSGLLHSLFPCWECPLPVGPAGQTTSIHLQIQPQNQCLENPGLLTRTGDPPTSRLPPRSASGYLARIPPHPSFLPTPRKNFRAEAIPLRSKKFNRDTTFQGSKRLREADVSAMNS